MFASSIRVIYSDNETDDEDENCVVILAKDDSEKEEETEKGHIFSMKMDSIMFHSSNNPVEILNYAAGIQSDSGSETEEDETILELSNKSNESSGSETEESTEDEEEEETSFSGLHDDEEEEWSLENASSPQIEENSETSETDTAETKPEKNLKIEKPPSPDTVKPPQNQKKSTKTKKLIRAKKEKKDLAVKKKSNNQKTKGEHVEDVVSSKKNISKKKQTTTRPKRKRGRKSKKDYSFLDDTVVPNGVDEDNEEEEEEDTKKENPSPRNSQRSRRRGKKKQKRTSDDEDSLWARKETPPENDFDHDPRDFDASMPGSGSGDRFCSHDSFGSDTSPFQKFDRNARSWNQYPPGDLSSQAIAQRSSGKTSPDYPNYPDNSRERSRKGQKGRGKRSKNGRNNSPSRLVPLSASSGSRHDYHSISSSRGSQNMRGMSRNSLPSSSEFSNISSGATMMEIANIKGSTPYSREFSQPAPYYYPHSSVHGSEYGIGNGPIRSHRGNVSPHPPPPRSSRDLSENSIRNSSSSVRGPYIHPSRRSLTSSAPMEDYYDPIPERNSSSSYDRRPTDYSRHSTRGYDFPDEFSRYHDYPGYDSRRSSWDDYYSNYVPGQQPPLTASPARMYPVYDNFSGRGGYGNYDYGGSSQSYYDSSGDRRFSSGSGRGNYPRERDYRRGSSGQYPAESRSPHSGNLYNSQNSWEKSSQENLKSSRTDWAPHEPSPKRQKVSPEQDSSAAASKKDSSPKKDFPVSPDSPLPVLPPKREDTGYQSPSDDFFQGYKPGGSRQGNRSRKRNKKPKPDPEPVEDPSDSQRNLCKKFCTNAVIKVVNLFNREEKIEKEEFKKICRKLAHQVLEKEERNNFVISEATGAKIHKFVDDFFCREPKFSSHPRVLKLKNK
mmetsp:Transcript_43162/g.66320  ORF Transcript_43162/g.66320 Transcript_43162/m.66320 type:complete len:892 (-) Transcript_43162:3013-5688(-)